ncbi:MAG TPA: hypothetical protein VGD67_08165 [Pseudonocardiaceae bacterium]
MAGGRMTSLPSASAGVALAPGEVVHGVFRRGTGVEVVYSRFFAANVEYVVPGSVAIGPPAFVAGHLLTSAARRSQVRREAHRKAAPQWRRAPWLATVVTSRRLMCQIRHGNGTPWISIYHAALAELRLTGLSLVMTPISGPPIGLTGAWAPWCAAVTAHYRYGYGLAAGHAVPELDQAARTA